MDSAASLPAATASTTVAGPVPASPPEKTPSMDVAYVTGSTLYGIPAASLQIGDTVPDLWINDLAYRGNDRISLHDELRPADGNGSPAARLVGRAEFHFDALEAGHFSVAHHFYRRRPGIESWLLHQ